MEFGIKIVQECQRQQAQCLNTCYAISMTVDISDAAQLSRLQSHIRAHILINSLFGLATSQASCHRFLKAETRIQFRSSPRGIYDG